MSDAPPEAWGNAKATWDGFNVVPLATGPSSIPQYQYETLYNPDGTTTQVKIEIAQEPDNGLLTTQSAYNGMLTALQQLIDRLEQANPSYPLGLIANRMPSLTFRDYTGYQLTDIDPLTAEQVAPNMYYDRSGQPYDAPLGSELGVWSLGERFIRSALSRGAIAPMWEVETAAMQTQAGDPMAGITEEERAARANKLAPALTASDASQTFRPVALDLNGDGVQTTGTTQAVAINVDDSGYLKNTAWLSNSDAFLWLDRNLNGQMDGGKELFNNSFVALSERGLGGMRWLDADYNGKLTALDPVWNELKVWQDANGNGQTETGEVSGLSQLGITELNYSMGTFTQNGTIKQLASPDLAADAQGTRINVIPEGILVESSQGQVSLIVTQVDDQSAIEANRDGVTGIEDVEFIISSADLLANDSLAGISGSNPIAGQSLSITAVSGFTHGTGYLDANGMVHFTPEPNYNGTAQFQYTLTASTGQSTTATVNLNIQAVNDDPVVTGIDRLLEPIYGYDKVQIKAAYDGDPAVYGKGAAHYQPYTGFDFVTGTNGYHGTPIEWYDPEPNVSKILVSDPDGDTSFTYSVSVQAQMGEGKVDANGYTSYVNWAGPNTPGAAPDGQKYVGRDTYIDTYSTQPDAYVVTVSDGNGGSTTAQVPAQHTGAYYLDLGSGAKKPISVDLGGDGFGFTDVNDSDIFFDVNSDGFKHKTAWPTAGDGLLAFDANSNGLIDDGSEISFVGYKPDAQTDLQGLAAFDSNNDGIFSALDEKWGDFGIWQDANQNGLSDAGEFLHLNDMGIAAINLVSDGQFSVINGQTVHGVGTILKTDGSTLNMADVTLEYSSQVQLQNPDGTVTVVDKPAFAPSGEVINGTPDKDLLLGNNGNTVINGMEGDDAIVSGIGNDIIDGGSGNDLIYGAEGNDLIAGGTGDDVVFGGLGNDFIAGGDGHDALMGEQGNDIIFGADGNDFISGGEGSDVLVAGNGDDQVFGESGNDALFGEAGNDQLAGMEGYDRLSGGAGDDYLDGGAQDDELFGGDGNDTLMGGAGSDWMEGGAGDDVYVVDSISDHVVEVIGAGIDTVQSSVTYTLSDNVENLTLTGAAAINASGNALDNILTGNSSANVLDGGAGADTLIGGQGNDTLMGGAGNDRYEFNLGDGADTIVDASGLDTLFVGGNLIEANLEGFRVGNDMLISVMGTTDSITLTNWFAQGQGVQRIEFADGSFLDTVGIEGLLNRPPVANPDDVTVDEDTVQTAIPVSTLLANDTDPNTGDVISLAGFDAVSALGNTIAHDANGNLVLDIGQRYQSLAQGQTVTDTFGYTISDRKGETDSTLVNVTITGVNDAPITVADDATALQEDLNITAIGNVLSNDSDIDQGTILQVANAGVFIGQFGTLTLNADGSYSYALDNASQGVQSLAQGQVVTDTFNYAATDGITATPSTLTVSISGTNDAPVVVAVVNAVLEEVVISATGNVLANDSDIDQGTVLQVANAGVYVGQFGTLTLNADGSYSYALDNASLGVQSLAQGQVVTDTFDYAATDGITSTPSTLTVSITGTNDAPVVAADVNAVQEDVAISATGNVLANDSDIDQGTVLSVESAGTFVGQFGTLTLNADGSYSYALDNASYGVQSLAQGQVVTDTFDYAATDGITSTPSILTVSITGTNDAPVVVADVNAVQEDLNITATGNVLSNDSDIDQGTVLQVANAGVFVGQFGTLTLNADGSYSYALDNASLGVQSLAQGQIVTDTFDYAATDGMHRSSRGSAPSRQRTHRL
jgi:VCBS repeat-containing protein